MVGKFTEFVYNLSKINQKLGVIETAFKERVNFALQVVAGKASLNKRTIYAPYYLNDLGIRHSSSPRLFMNEIVKKTDISIPSTEEIVNELMNINIDKLGIWLDTVVLITGDFKSAYLISEARKTEIIKSKNYDLLIYSGSAASATKKPETGSEFFEYAAKFASSTIGSVIAKHRYLVTKLKRERNFELFDKQILNLLFNDILQLKKNDQLQVIPLVDNLVALRILMGNDVKSDSLINSVLLFNAQKLLDMSKKDTDDQPYINQSVRYQSQISINQVQVLHAMGKNKEAVEILETNLEQVKQYSEEYVSEALGALSYALYIAERYHDAVKYGKSAILEYAKVGNTTGIATTRQVLVGSYSKLGNKSEIKNEIYFLKEDKLGLKESENISIA